MKILKRIIDKFREWWNGRCPHCGSLNVRDVYQWNQQQCDDCHKSWRVPGFE